MRKEKPPLVLKNPVSPNVGRGRPRGEIPHFQAVIYIAKHKKNGRCYVGRTFIRRGEGLGTGLVDSEAAKQRRRKKHEDDADNMRGAKFQEAIRVCGKRAFRWDVLKVVPDPSCKRCPVFSPNYPDGWEAVKLCARLEEAQHIEDKEAWTRGYNARRVAGVHLVTNPLVPRRG